MTSVTPVRNYGMGWRRDQPDPRDHKFATAREIRAALPPTADVRQTLTYFLDQGNIGSCTANSSAYVNDADRVKNGRQPLRPSRLFQYYNARVLEGTVTSDSGASIRNTIQAMVKWGACPEIQWPYDISRFRERPPETCYTFGAERQVIEYMRVDQSLGELMGAIASGYPIIYGMLIFSQFESLPSHGVVAMPSPADRPIGGHSGVLCHYWTDQQGQVWFVDKNTWGENWGAGGYGYLPAGYLLNPQLCDDFWIVKSIEAESPEPPPPTPQPTPFNVGPGVLKLMAQLGDRPAGPEKYFPQGPFSKSITEGEQYFYEWEELIDTVKATPKRQVIVGTR